MSPWFYARERSATPRPLAAPGACRRRGSRSRGLTSRMQTTTSMATPMPARPAMLRSIGMAVLACATLGAACSLIYPVGDLEGPEAGGADAAKEAIPEDVAHDADSARDGGCACKGNGRACLDGGRCGCKTQLDCEPNNACTEGVCSADCGSDASSPCNEGCCNGAICVNGKDDTACGTGVHYCNDCTLMCAPGPSCNRLDAADYVCGCDTNKGCSTHSACGARTTCEGVTATSPGKCR
jgi:hypothetical protein